jgi:hypothetical protein
MSAIASVSYGFTRYACFATCLFARFILTYDFSVLVYSYNSDFIVASMQIRTLALSAFIGTPRSSVLRGDYAVTLFCTASDILGNSIGKIGMRYAAVFVHKNPYQMFATTNRIS